MLTGDIMKTFDCHCDTGAIVQRTVQRTPDEDHVFEVFVPTRPSALDAACSASGPGYAVFADENGVRGIGRYDVERGCPIDHVPPSGFVS